MATLNMIYHTLAGIVGNAFFGYLYDYGGSDFVYLVSAGILAASIAVFALYQEHVEVTICLDTCGNLRFYLCTIFTSFIIILDNIIMILKDLSSMLILHTFQAELDDIIVIGTRSNPRAV